MPVLPLEYLNMLVTGTFPEAGIRELADDAAGIGHFPEKQSHTTARALTLANVPSYIDLAPAAGWAIRGAKRYPGFRIRLDGLTNLEEYLLGQFGKGRQSSFKLYRKRLERSFDIRYVVYYGAMEDSAYTDLFDALMEMVRKRFQEKEALNESQHKFPFYRKHLLDAIRQGRANCQVIYDGNHPVYISFNLIAGKGIIGLINSFDTAYVKFYPGFTGILHLVEWALGAGYNHIDLLKGDLSYKRLFSNDIYACQTIFLYRKNSIPLALGVSLKTAQLNLFRQLLDIGKRLGLRDIYHRYKHWKYVRSRNQAPDSLAGFQFVPHSGTETPDFDGMVALDKPNGLVRRALYSYLYHSGEHRSQIQLFESPDGSVVFLKGPNGLARMNNLSEKRADS